MEEYQLKRVISTLLTLALVISLTACGNSGSAGNASNSLGSQSAPVSIDTLKLGTDYKDLKANLKFITNRTDVVDTTYKQYVLEFQKLYPNINITYQADTNYSDNMTTRLTTNSWGDICMIPTTLKKTSCLHTSFLWEKRARWKRPTSSWIISPIRMKHTACLPQAAFRA